MDANQLRVALRELNGERDLTIAFAEVFWGGQHAGSVPGASVLEVKRAMLIPDEADHLVKVTDGKAVYVVDASRVVWMKIGLKEPAK